MKSVAIGILSLLLNTPLLAQAPPKTVTVPVTLDHNRIVIDVYIPLKDGTTKRVRGLVDTAATGLMLSPRVAKMAGGSLSCDDLWCKTDAPAAILIADTRILLAGAGGAKVPVRPDAFNDVLIPGMSPEVVIPSTILKNYDLVIDYANRQFTIGPPGSVKFAGTASQIKASSNGLLTVSSKVDGRTFNFGIDTGSSATQVFGDQVAEWHKKQPAWPYAAGALGAANMTGGSDELPREMLRVPTLQLGASTLREVLVGSTAKPVEDFEKQSHGPVIGLVGGEAFKGSRIGIDHAHQTLYIDGITSSPVTGLDVVGLTVRPEIDGRYTVVAVVPFEGQPSVGDVQTGDVLVGVDGAPVTGATMGQVWSLLGGEPGQARKLILERAGKRLAIEATVRRFLAAKPN